MQYVDSPHQTPDAVIFTFECGTTLGANRGLLALHSPVLERMLFGDMREGEPNLTIPLPWSATAFRHLLQYCHTGLIAFTQDTWLDLYQLAEHYAMDQLIAALTEIIIEAEFIDGDNAISVLAIASACGNTALLHHCVQALAPDAAECVECDEFLDLSADALVDLLRSDDFALNEIDVFRAIVRWGRVQTARSAAADVALGGETPLDEVEHLKKVVKWPLERAVRFGLVPTRLLMTEVQALGAVDNDVVMQALAFQADRSLPCRDAAEAYRRRPRRRPGTVSDSADASSSGMWGSPTTPPRALEDLLFPTTGPVAGASLFPAGLLLSLSAASSAPTTGRGGIGAGGMLRLSSPAVRRLTTADEQQRQKEAVERKFHRAPANAPAVEVKHPVAPGVGGNQPLPPTLLRPTEPLSIDETIAHLDQLNTAYAEHCKFMERQRQTATTEAQRNEGDPTPHATETEAKRQLIRTMVQVHKTRQLKKILKAAYEERELKLQTSAPAGSPPPPIAESPSGGIPSLMTRPVAHFKEQHSRLRRLVVGDRGGGGGVGGD